MVIQLSAMWNSYLRTYLFWTFDFLDNVAAQTDRATQFESITPYSSLNAVMVFYAPNKLTFSKIPYRSEYCTG